MSELALIKQSTVAEKVPFDQEKNLEREQFQTRDRVWGKGKCIRTIWIKPYWPYGDTLWHTLLHSPELENISLVMKFKHYWWKTRSLNFHSSCITALYYISTLSLSEGLTTRHERTSVPSPLRGGGLQSNEFYHSPSQHMTSHRIHTPLLTILPEQREGQGISKWKKKRVRDDSLA